jgi:hypothetical protein
MNEELLRDLRREFGTVSSLTENSGIVAVRNLTARKRLATLVGCSKVGGTLADRTAGWPRLVLVTERDAEAATGHGRY